MFSLVATAALLFAGGIGAGTVMAYDQLSGSVDAQNAATPDSPASAAEALSAGAGGNSVGDLMPIFIMDGEVGYAYQGALEAANRLTEAYTHPADATGSEASAALVPIYLADGVTLVGYYNRASLIPK